MDDEPVDGGRVIDLDLVEPADSSGVARAPAGPGPMANRWRRLMTPRMPIAIAVALMVVVGASAVVITKLQLASERPAVSVAVVPGQVAVNVWADRGDVALDGALTVVNTGSTTVTITGIQMDPAGAGLTSGPTSPRLTDTVNISVAPGKTAIVAATVWYRCPATRSMASQIAVDFKPAVWVRDGSGTQQSFRFRADAWAQQMVEQCVYASHATS